MLQLSLSPAFSHKLASTPAACAATTNPTRVVALRRPLLACNAAAERSTQVQDGRSVAGRQRSAGERTVFSDRQASHAAAGPRSEAARPQSAAPSAHPQRSTQKTQGVPGAQPATGRPASAGSSGRSAEPATSGLRAPPREGDDASRRPASGISSLQRKHSRHQAPAGGRPGDAGRPAAGAELTGTGAAVPKWRTTRLQVDWASAPPPPPGVDLKGLASRLMAPPRDESLPSLDALVVVEGFNDCLALHKAVRAPVYVMGGGGVLADAMRPELRYLGQLAGAGVLPRQLVVFTDPDWQGRTYRTLLEDELRVVTEQAEKAAAKAKAKAEAGGKGAAGVVGAAAATSGPVVGGAGQAAVLRPGASRLLKPAAAAAPAAQVKQEAKQETAAVTATAAPAAVAPAEVIVRHAFLRVELATSEAESRRHEAGNVGVEHAAPDTIRTCLRRARPGFGPGRTEFTAEGLQADGLIGVWNDKTKVAGPGLRRGRFCRALGIDEVGSGKALANLLNRYFSRADYAAALEACEMQQDAAQEKSDT